MIVVVILATIVGIAIPSYLEHQKKAKAAVAWSVIYEIASQEELYRADARQYTNSQAALNVTTPPDVDVNYDIAITDTPAGFTITATPKGSMTGTNKLTLNHLGIKTGE